MSNCSSTCGLHAQQSDFRPPPSPGHAELNPASAALAVLQGKDLLVAHIPLALSRHLKPALSARMTILTLTHLWFRMIEKCDFGIVLAHLHHLFMGSASSADLSCG